jgi:predicted GH43/DUF377 family glycosyl hydrolase
VPALDVGPMASWYSQAVTSPTVVFDGHIYRMWFTGSRPVRWRQSPYLGNGSIGMAVSSDGVHWTVANGGRPVLRPGEPGAFDQHSVDHSFVLLLGSTYYMWYTGLDGTLARHHASLIRVERIGLATSTDGMHWTRANGGEPVLDVGGWGSIDKYQADAPHVLYDRGIFTMWYGAYNGLHTIAVATSPDGVHWTKVIDPRPVIGLRYGPDGEWGALGPSIERDGGSYLLLYSSRWHRPSHLDESQRAIFGASSSDGLHWQPLSGGRPLLDGWAGDGRNQAVHPSQVVRPHGRPVVYYAAESDVWPHHQRIFRMELPSPWPVFGPAATSSSVTLPRETR